MPPNISEQIYCTAELRFVNCELSIDKKKKSNNNNLAKGIGWSLLSIVTVLKEGVEQPCQVLSKSKPLVEFCNSHLGHFGLLPRFSSINDRGICVSLLLTRFTVRSPETRLTSPEIFIQVARNFTHAQQHPNNLIALVSFQQIFKNNIYYSLDVLKEIFYTLISLFSSLHRIKNKIWHTFIPTAFVSPYHHCLKNET